MSTGVGPDLGVVVLAHHPFVDALPVVLPAVVLSGAFGLIVWSDRRRARRARAQVSEQSVGQGGGQGTMEG